MNNIYIVVGSRGIVGSQVLRRLRYLGKSVFIKTTSQILGCNPASMEQILSAELGKSSINTSQVVAGIIFAHRCRDTNRQVALYNELCITRDFTWALTKQFKSVRAVVLGSITGRLVDKKQAESYHYSKDLQKSIVRQSVRIHNLSMNLIELNWFEKYPYDMADDKYREVIGKLKQEVGDTILPTIDSITDMSCLLIEMSRPPRGQSIVYDGGLSLFQKD